jgi:hypothetical protein
MVLMLELVLVHRMKMVRLLALKWGQELDFGVGAGVWAETGVGAGEGAENGADAELEAWDGVGVVVTAEEPTGLETSVGVSVGVGVLERELELVRGLELVLARG